ncbi:serine/threonine-protein kinase [Actinoplanes sp. NPDC023801]|uniref:serine/threonine-protein kinase n=1 Tax=Actinoplanes sp. NPDC023801 TaxID=3154595 RepID=UPI0033EB9456
MTAVGEVVGGRYRLVRPLVSGRTSRIWLASDEGAGGGEARPGWVVVKHCVIPQGLTRGQHELIRDWVLPEAVAAARVRHPHVIRALDVLPAWDGPWLVMEYLPFRSLQQLIEESGPLPPARVARIGLALLSALAAAGRAGVLHLDVKPDNVLIAGDGRPVLTDFSPTVTPNGIRTLADAGIILGSPKYIAPERIFDHLTDERADLWSLGATLYHAVEGHPPFQRATTAEVLHAVGKAKPEAPRRAGRLTPVLAGLLRRDPAARMTAAEAEQALRAVADAGRRPRSAALRRIPSIAAAVAVATTLTAVAATAEGETRAATTYPSPSASAPAPGGGTKDTPLPTGFRWWTEPGGYRVAVPVGWRRDASAAGLTFRAGRDRAMLAITPLPETPADVVAALQEAELKGGLDDYERLRIETLPARSAVWEFTFKDADGTAMRGLRRVSSSGSRSYVIEWRATRDGWATQLTRFTVVLASFGPRPGA